MREAAISSSLAKSLNSPRPRPQAEGREEHREMADLLWREGSFLERAVEERRRPDGWEALSLSDGAEREGHIKNLRPTRRRWKTSTSGCRPCRVSGDDSSSPPTP